MNRSLGSLQALAFSPSAAAVAGGVAGESRYTLRPAMKVGEAPTLLQRVAAGDGAAVQLVLDRYGPLIWSIVRKQVRADLAEDLVQEVFIQVWKGAERYDPEIASEATYITTIARRRLIDQRRKIGRRPEHEVIVDEHASEGDELERVELADEARLAAQALAELKPEQQRVLRLALFEGLTHVEIAEATGTPLGTVKSHARRGLERVRQRIEEQRASGGGRS